VTPGAMEMVYAVPRDILMPDGSWRGVRTVDPTQILQTIGRHGSFYPRPEAEVDASIKQIIPYLVLRDGERIFLMKRTRAGGDARLHDHYTVGVGGHMNPGDGSIMETLQREWHEELVADFMPDFTYFGLLNDDEVDVGRHHLGVVYLADAAARAVAVRETHKLSGSFETIEVTMAAYGQMETWSQLVLDALRDRTSVAAAGSNP
jgi:predicted NUDIX family phosphoesterase